MRANRSVASCVEGLRQSLLEKTRTAPECVPVIRRKVRRLLAEAGKEHVTQSFVTELDQTIRALGLFASRPLCGRPLFQDDWLELSTQAFAPHSVFFPTEQELVEFMRRAIGVLPPLDNLKEISLEFQLPTRQRIDLLCEEYAQSGKGDLVAIEIKRGDPSYGVVTQLDNYLAALQAIPEAAGRQVRGLIISAPDQDSRSAQGAPSRNRIDWYFYRIALEPAARGVTGPSTATV